MQQLVQFFTEGLTDHGVAETVGAEVETAFVDRDKTPISLDVSQSILRTLSSNKRWCVTERKGDLIAKIADRHGNVICYELGRQNLEVATAPQKTTSVVSVAQGVLDELYASASACGAYPYFEPILQTSEELLVVPDKRDETWLRLDGRTTLAELAKISSVQFTLSVSPKEAIDVLNALGGEVHNFLLGYSQDRLWREYIATSSAGYRTDRYGGPCAFDDMRAYCLELKSHDVVCGDRLVPWHQAGEIDIPLHIRSVWWHFRLKRYGGVLCIEVRPISRRKDEFLEAQLSQVLEAACSFKSVV